MTGKKPNNTQAAVILKLLKQHKRGISRVTAASHNIYCLPERIRDLRDQGYKIESIRVPIFGDDGKEKSHYTNYKLVGERR